jgi:multiple sugar transport system substrate-binding protein
MIKLTGITWDHPRGYAPLEASTARYLQQAGVHITWHRRTLKDFGDISVETLAQQYDLLVIDHPHMGTIDQSGCLIDLTHHLSEAELNSFQRESVGPSFASYQYNGQQYAIPVDAACQAAAYRPDLLNAAQLPATWKDVMGLSDSLRSKKQFVATALCATDCNCIFLTLCAQHESPVTGTGMELIPVAEGVRILQLMMDLKNASHPHSLNWNPVALYDHMISATDVVYSPLAFAYINYATGNKKALLRFAEIPGRTQSILGGAGMAVSASSKHIPEAVDYLKWICDPQYQADHYMYEGGQPGQLSAWTNQKNIEHSGDFLSAVLPIMNSAYMRPRLPLWPSYQEMVGDLIHEYLAKNSDPVPLMEKLNNGYRKLFS